MKIETLFGLSFSIVSYSFYHRLARKSEVDKSERLMEIELDSAGKVKGKEFFMTLLEKRAHFVYEYQPEGKNGIGIKRARKKTKTKKE